MDPITHGITGALLGKAYFSKPHARVAVFAATLGAVFPDIDVFYEAYAEIAHQDPLAIVRYHRAITHSFVALPFFALLLAWLTHAIARRLGIASPSAWMLTLIYGVGIASHIVLDGMTSFGTRMWYPISQRRVAWDWLFIIDFTFTSIILAPQVIAWIYRDTQRGREKSLARALGMWALFTVGLAFTWLLAYEVGTPFHWWIVGHFERALRSHFLSAASWRLGISREKLGMVPGGILRDDRLSVSLRHRSPCGDAACREFCRNQSHRGGAHRRIADPAVSCSIGATLFALPMAFICRNLICASRSPRRSDFSPILPRTLSPGALSRNLMCSSI